MVYILLYKLYFIPAYTLFPRWLLYTQRTYVFSKNFRKQLLIQPISCLLIENFFFFFCRPKTKILHNSVYPPSSMNDFNSVFFSVPTILIFEEYLAPFYFFRFLVRSHPLHLTDVCVSPFQVQTQIYYRKQKLQVAFQVHMIYLGIKYSIELR